MKINVQKHKQFQFHFVLCVFVLLSLACGRTASASWAVSTSTVQAATFTPIQIATATTSSTPSPTSTIVASDTPLPPASSTPVATSTELPTATSTVVPSPAALTGPAQVDFIDVGQGDSILVQSPDGKVALIDGGETGSGVLAYLSNKGITHIDLMVATHPHADHIGGLVDVLGAIKVDRVVTNGQPHTTQIYERFLDGIASDKAEYLEVKRGDTLPLGSLSFEVLSPAMTAPSGDMNNNSVVLRLAVGKVTFLFTGDAQANAEAGMISAGMPLKADILKVGHHGSHTSSSAAFLNQVQPAVAVYMAGAGNSYGHPHAETVAALNSVGAAIYGTDINGTVAITTDGNTYQVSGQGGSRAPPVQATEVQATEAPAQNGSVSLEIVSVTSPVAPNALATLQAATTPGASCNITVYYKSGPSKASGLSPKTADGAGTVSWSWKVGGNTTPGTWRIVDKCDQGGQSVTKETNFTVQR